MQIDFNLYIQDVMIAPVVVGAVEHGGSVLGWTAKSTHTHTRTGFV